MKLTCQKCEANFSARRTRAYCDSCIQRFQAQKQNIKDTQNPMPGWHLDGEFVAPKECPRTIFCEKKNANVCGLCGSDEVTPGYGLGSGYGMGSYNFCMDCYTFLDFSEDIDE